ncbi:shwachman-Bodian-diamond syndrome protein-like protein [Massarina eburnea CBS 473.64]|uniref:Shwachman-Bodian-diamond syndrome protein-like protein n=1 Tax=Massarina eburnea CBS 473.64 TaxID=1395130 RepID=A0A6A6S6P2_9PLEO|nr:shwachman-Bodian-diamond syndrome protein-like protein [Massarina eburnea CBS 473.64]
MPINQPSNQIKLTNLTLVRMKKNGKRFELACYKNKMMDWRDKIEDNPDNVLQIAKIYSNVNRGELASKAELAKAWPGKETEYIIKDILDNGNYQVNDKERNAKLDRTKHELLDMVASKLVDPKTKRVYTVGMIEKALDQLSSQAATQNPPKPVPGEIEEGSDEPKKLHKWTGVQAGQDVKVQSGWAIKALVAHQPIPVMEVQMKLRITCLTSVLKTMVKEENGASNVKDTILGYFVTIETQDTVGAEWEVVGLVEPGSLKKLRDFIESHTKGRGNVEVLDMAVGMDDE